MAEFVRFDISTLTMSELGEAEYASGLTADQLLKSGTYRLLLGVYVTRLRDHRRSTSLGQVQTPLPSWQELLNLRVQDAGSSPLLSGQDNPSPKSNASE